MHSQRFACCAFKRLALGLLAGLIFASGFSVHDSLAQDGSGVKIDLTLTPPKPAATSPKGPSESKDKTDSKSAEKSKETTNGKAEPDASAKRESAFVLSAFTLSPDQTSRTKGSSSDGKKSTGSSLTLEAPPAPMPKATAQTKAPETTPAATPEADKPAKLPTDASKTKEIKPLKIKDHKALPDNNEDAEGTECPGGAESAKKLPALPDDLPLEQEDHPYDAPAAESTSNKPDRPATKPSLTSRPMPLSNEQLRLRSEINQLLRYYMQHPETIARRSPWAVMHAILPYGVEAELSAGNRRVNAIGWMSYNGLCKTQRIFQPTKTGFRTNLGPGVQGHEGQYLAILAQSKVAPTYPLKVGNRTYSVNDLVRYEMATCREKSELTFKLIGLSYYLDQDQQWRDNQGGSWSLEKLVAEELEQPIVGAACGGTHRLMGLTFSLLQRKQAGLPIDGHWSRSEQFLNEFVAYAFSLQNPDGSFSTDWFEARANDPEIERKVQTTGHILEWLIYTLPDEQLQAPPVQKAIRFLLNTIGAEPGRDWPIGPRGHSLRALALYNQRVFGAEPGKLKQYIATLNSDSKQR